MGHPYTSEHVGFREFDGSSFGELQETEWQFDSTAEDVRDFVDGNIGLSDSIREVGDGTYDATLGDGREFRIYTRAEAPQ